MPKPLAIPRPKTAIHRTDLSRPLKCSLRDGLLGSGTSLFDSGCGHGHDLDLCQSRGIAAGWDPVFRPDTPLLPADVVNLGFVRNVSEDTAERAAALRHAWQLAGRLLIVAAGAHVPGRGHSAVESGPALAGRRRLKWVTSCSAARRPVAPRRSPRVPPPLSFR
jgi:DNA phosphorothioation-associated putative methyltransferase